VLFALSGPPVGVEARTQALAWAFRRKTRLCRWMAKFQREIGVGKIEQAASVCRVCIGVQRALVVVRACA
jgi:hypothetical protein